MAKIPYSEFVEGLDAAAALDGTEKVVILQDGVPVESTTQDIADLGAGYLVYTALLSQSGTDAPVATVLENTLGGTVVWTRANVGEYVGTLAGVFITEKTWCNATGDYDSALICAMTRASDDAVFLYTLDDLPALSDVFSIVSVEIRVYP